MGELLSSGIAGEAAEEPQRNCSGSCRGNRARIMPGNAAEMVGFVQPGLEYADLGEAERIRLL
jgi:hypothetical protein